MSHPSSHEEERRTSFLELFFDLVLVFAVTQLAAMLHDVPHHHAGHELVGWAEVGLLAALTWWLWSQFAWLGTSVRLSATAPRVISLALTGLLLVAAVALPVALAPGVAAFGLAYGLVKLGALVLYSLDTLGDRSHAAAVRAYVVRASIAPLVVMGASFLPPGPRLAAWALALAAEVGSALVVSGQSFRVSPTHFAERHALMLIIVLGESVVALGSKVVPTELGLPEALSLLGGFSLVAALWWTYFAWSVEAAEAWLRGRGRPFAPGDGSAVGRMARDAFTFGHFPLVAGMIAVAVALKDLAAAPLEPWSHEARTALCVGLTLYLGGYALVVWRGNGHVLYERVIAMVTLVVCTLLLPLPAGAVAALLAAVLVVTVGVEVRRWRRLMAAKRAGA